MILCNLCIFPMGYQNFLTYSYAAAISNHLLASKQRESSRGVTQSAAKPIMQLRSLRFRPLAQSGKASYPQPKNKAAGKLIVII